MTSEKPTSPNNQPTILDRAVDDYSSKSQITNQSLFTSENKYRNFKVSEGLKKPSHDVDAISSKMITIKRNLKQMKSELTLGKQTNPGLAAKATDEAPDSRFLSEKFGMPSHSSESVSGYASKLDSTFHEDENPQTSGNQRLTSEWLSSLAEARPSTLMVEDTNLTEDMDSTSQLGQKLSYLGLGPCKPVTSSIGNLSQNESFYDPFPLRRRRSLKNFFRSSKPEKSDIGPPSPQADDRDLSAELFRTLSYSEELIGRLPRPIRFHSSWLALASQPERWRDLRNFWRKLPRFNQPYDHTPEKAVRRVFNAYGERLFREKKFETQPSTSTPIQELDVRDLVRGRDYSECFSPNDLIKFSSLDEIQRLRAAAFEKDPILSLDSRVWVCSRLQLKLDLQALRKLFLSVVTEHAKSRLDLVILMFAKTNRGIPDSGSRIVCVGCGESMSCQFSAGTDLYHPNQGCMLYRAFSDILEMKEE